MLQNSMGAKTKKQPFQMNCHDSTVRSQRIGIKPTTQTLFEPRVLQIIVF